jgi:F-type H+-transporting ATPase subunit epsilon
VIFEMTTPEAEVLKTDAEFVVLPAVKGEMGVLPGHAPFIVQLNPGAVRVTVGGEVRLYAVSGGFAEIKDDHVSLFAETAEMAGGIDAERAKQALERAKALVVSSDIDPMTLASAEAAIRRAQVRLRVSSLRRGYTGK